jgi:hypothetical protein
MIRDIAWLLIATCAALAIPAAIDRAATKHCIGEAFKARVTDMDTAKKVCS